MDRQIIKSVRSGLTTLLIASVAGVFGFGATPATARTVRAFSGGLAPTVYGSLADLNGDAVVNGADDSNEFYGSTSIIDGALDCDAWATANDGTAGDLSIDASDDCTLVGYDGTPDGVTIAVVNGEFTTADGAAISDGQRLPRVFNAAAPDDPSVLASDFAWSTINGRVDANGDETIDGQDCHFGLIGETADAGLGDATDGADVLASDLGCGFAGVIAPALNGLVDLNSDEDITGADTCLDGCFFGRDVVKGVVSNTACTLLGTNRHDTLRGTPASDIICGRGGNDTLIGRGGRDVIKGEAGDDLMKGGRRGDSLDGGRGPDTARGGPGRDRCVSAVVQDSCER
jgi:Ca2+-binding RTX toxin-like protein